MRKQAVPIGGTVLILRDTVNFASRHGVQYFCIPGRTSTGTSSIVVGGLLTCIFFLLITQNNGPFLVLWGVALLATVIHS